MRRLLKPWGRDDLPAPFAAGSGEAVGEIWFDTPPSLETVLAKYLFTGERLSVQVHPRAEFSPTGIGKDECWLVTGVQPGARIALGFAAPATTADIRAAALDGTIESLMAWHEVQVGDFFYVPSGTVHSMGPGLTLLEIQQNTDITYRLFDYGRPRELHLDEALRSIIAAPHPEALRHRVDPSCEAVLVDGDHFLLAQCIGRPSEALAQRLTGPVQVLPLEGACKIEGAPVPQGASGWARRLDLIDFSDDARVALVVSPRLLQMRR